MVYRRFSPAYSTVLHFRLGLTDIVHEGVWTSVCMWHTYSNGK